ncbi:hypothetical protein [Kitasatospora sp. GP82]|uniref:hypothetical protein n=1 Tax=Kitasatospora sp. GP82 TaxID=3035089 RepID=UPI0024772119|nr:hypothetical protein [Kitasatospora sp. GP82]MDH6126669.1 hypothetical protein [Kitasatospora sp. GP82]
MRNGLVQLAAWVAATSAAVALSWLGVHAVLTDAAFEQPRAVPLPSPGGRVSDGPSAQQAASAASAGSPAASPTVSETASASPSASAPPSPSAGRSTAQGSAADASVRSVLVPGGRVALSMEPDRADLVSAAPDPGWQMQVWHGEGWLRVDFSQGSKANSVFATWNGHPPDVQSVVR